MMMSLTHSCETELTGSQNDDWLLISSGVRSAHGKCDKVDPENETHLNGFDD